MHKWMEQNPPGKEEKGISDGQADDKEQESKRWSEDIVYVSSNNLLMTGAVY